MSTAVEETNIAILAVINSTDPYGFEPMTSAIPLQGSQYCRGHGFKSRTAPVSQRSWVQIPCGPELFSGLVFITARIAINISFNFLFLYNGMLMEFNSNRNEIYKTFCLVFRCNSNRKFTAPKLYQN